MKFTPVLSSALVALASSLPANAWFRVACTAPLVSERVDPIVNPDSIPSNHVHTVHGASNFACNSTYDTLRASNCTSCEVVQDLSNYWFPKLYFQDPNTGLLQPVANGGLLVYYENRGDGDVSNGGSGLTAFPAGFRMISGNPALRSTNTSVVPGSQEDLAQQAITWSCLRYTTSYPGYDGYGFPTTDCEAGFNARIHMPACWDGVNLDSPDHTSHVAFLSGLDNGACPSTHPVYMMKLFYEITWDVTDFASNWDPTVNAWPFVYANGDPTGYSWHGDFQNGWDVTALQNAIDYCNNPDDETGQGVTEACSYLNVTQAAIANECKIAPVVDEQIDGMLSMLPGCNPMQDGPEDATFYSSSNCPFSPSTSTNTTTTTTTSLSTIISTTATTSTSLSTTATSTGTTGTSTTITGISTTTTGTNTSRSATSTVTITTASASASASPSCICLPNPPSDPF